MSRLLDNTGESVVSSNTITADGSWSLAFWMRANASPSANTSEQVKLSDNTAGSNEVGGFSYDHANVAFRAAAFMRNAAGSYVAAKMTSTPSADTWYAYGVTYSSGAPGTLTVYFQGVAEDTDSSNVGGTTGQALIIHRNAVTGANVEIEWATAWNGVALTAQEMLAFAKGLQPWRIRPASLAFLYPYRGNISPEPDFLGRGTGTVTGATKGANTAPVVRGRTYSFGTPTPSNNQTVNASPVTFSLAIPTPSVSGTGAAGVTASPVTFSLAIPTPSVSTGAQVVTASPVAFSLANPTPSVSGSGAAPVTASPVTFSLANPTPSVAGTGSAGVTASPVAFSLVIPTPSISQGLRVTASPVVFALGIPTPGVAGTGSAGVTASPVTMALTIPTPTISGTGAAAVIASPVTYTLTIPTPTILNVNVATAVKNPTRLLLSNDGGVSVSLPNDGGVSVNL